MEFKKNTAPLEEVIEKFIDYRGKTPKKTSYGIPLITAKVIKEGFVQEVNEFIAEEDYEAWMRRGIPMENDVVLTTEAPLGEVALINTDKKIALAQRVITLRGKEDVLDNIFLKYSLQGPVMQARLRERESGSTVTGIKSSELKKVIIDFPDIEFQKRIGAMLKNLDDKISMNKKMITNLEQLAQTLFKRWFVDFEFPNEDGESYKSSGGEMIEFEGELIPKEWKAFKLTDLVSSISESINKKERATAIFLNTSDISDGKVLHQEYTDTREMPGQAKKLIKRGDILYSEIRPKNKRYTYIDFDSEDYVVSTKLMVLRTKEDLFSSKVMYLFLTGEKVVNELQSIAEFRSGTFPQITFKQLDHFKFILPEKKDFLDNYKILEEMIEYQFLINKENDNLKEMRDTLLPKLLTGEIEIPDETEVIEDVPIW